MAQLRIDVDPLQPGRWHVQSDHLAALAAVPDAICQVLQLDGENLAAWALHPTEQDGLRDAAYHEELHELGPGAHAVVEELVRPWQQHVVWVDRYHLLVGSAHTSRGSRLLGLYVGSKGRIVLAVHHPSVAGLVSQAIAQLPANAGQDWEQPGLVANCRFVVSYTPRAPSSVEVRAPQPMALQVQDALGRLGQLAAGW